MEIKVLRSPKQVEKKQWDNLKLEETKNEDWHYIVSGYCRTGTSMMMMCLEAGGMEAVYHKEQIGSPIVNKYGNFECGGYMQMGDEFPSNPQLKGKVVKCMYHNLKHMDRAKFRIVFMLRDPKEIRISHNKALRRGTFFGKSDETYWREMREAVERYENMENIEITVMDYHIVLKEPQICFTHLKSQGWPIGDVEAAASKVEVDLWRIRESHSESEDDKQWLYARVMK